MAISKDELYGLIDRIPVEKYGKVKDVLRDLSIPEEILTEEEEAKLDEAAKRMDDGEYVTIDELYKKIVSDDE